MSAARDRAESRAAAASPEARPPAVARARALLPMIEAAAPRIEAERRLPADVVAALHAAALFRTLLPRALGGEELPPHDHVRVTEAIAAADASTAWCIGQASGCSLAAAYMQPEIAREIWGPADAVVAWGAQYGDALAEVVDGGYRVTGTWHFASGGHHATWFGGHCHVKERDGAIRMGADGVPIERTMMFRAGTAPLQDVWRVVGLRGTGSDSYSVTDLFVPEVPFIFGEADRSTRAAIISLARLRPELGTTDSRSELLRKRLASEVIHQMGLIRGLAHCPNNRCVMFMSTTVQETDKKGLQLCANCRKRLGSSDR